MLVAYKDAATSNCFIGLLKKKKKRKRKVTMFFIYLFIFIFTRAGFRSQGLD